MKFHTFAKPMTLVAIFNYMHKLVIGFFLVHFFCYTAKCQLTNKEKSNALFKETVSPFMDLLLLQRPDLDSSKTHKDSVSTLATSLISKYFEIYRLDSLNNKYVEYYIADCYRFAKEYSKAIYWYQHELAGSTDENDIRSSFRFIGESFILLGELDSAMYYITIANSIDIKSGNINKVLYDIIAQAKIIFKYCEAKLVDILKAKGVKPCQYSIEILKRIDTLPKTKDFYVEEPILKLISNMEKNCN